MYGSTRRLNSNVFFVTGSRTSWSGLHQTPLPYLSAICVRLSERRWQESCLGLLDQLGDRSFLPARIDSGLKERLDQRTFLLEMRGPARNLSPTNCQRANRRLRRPLVRT